MIHSEPTRTYKIPSEGAVTENGQPTTGTGITPISNAGQPLVILPGYEMLEELGRGAMGVVYRARQMALNREVAIKVLASDRVQPRDLIRFLAEAEAIAAIKHPNVVQVFEFGEQAGRPFMALEYCTGGTLAQRLKAGPLSAHEAAQMLANIASGVAAGHKLGIVHRDLKPGNILLHPSAGEALTPKVTDFGLAKQLHGHDLTTTQAVMGTPAYMAPEQARGDSKFVGPQADVWALGAILYECLTGRPPFRGSDTWSLLHHIQMEEPESLRSINGSIPRDLELICLKCLSKDVSDRYPTAEELAADLGRMLNGESVSVRAAGLVERTAKWAKRKPTLASAYALAAAVVVLVALGSGAAFLWQSAVGARDQLAVEKKAADEAKKEAELARDGEKAANENLAATHYAGTTALAYRQWAANRFALAGAILNECRPDLRGWEWDYLHTRTHREAFSLRGHEGAVYSVAYSPDGTLLASAGQDGTIRLWNSSTGASVAVLRGATNGVYSLSFDPTRSRLAAGGEDGMVRVWDLQTKQPLFVRDGDGDVTSIAYSPDGKYFAIGRANKKAEILAADTGRLHGELIGHTKEIGGVAFSPDSVWLATASFDKTLRFWEVETRLPGPVLYHPSPVLFVAFDPTFKLDPIGPAKHDRSGDAQKISVLLPDEKKEATPPVVYANPLPYRFATGSQDGKVLYWTNGTDRPARVFARDLDAPVISNNGDPILDSNSSNRISELAFRPDGKWLAAGREDGTTSFYKTDSSGVWFQMSDHTGRVASVCFAKDGNHFATAGEDGLVNIWDKGPCSTIFTEVSTKPQPGLEFISGLGFTDDSKKLLTGRKNAVAQETDIAVRLEKSVFHQPFVEVRLETNAKPPEPPKAMMPKATERPKDEEKKSNTPRKAPHRSDLFRVLYQSPAPTAPTAPDAPAPSTLPSVPTAPGGGASSTGSYSQISGSGGGIAPSSIHINDRAAPYAFGREGRWMTTNLEGNEIQLSWTRGTSREPVFAYLHWPANDEFRKAKDPLAGVAHPSLRGARTGNPHATTSVAISPTSGFVAAGRGNGQVILWNSETWQVRRLFKAHESTVAAMAISPDGKLIATAGFDHVVYVWNAESGEKVTAMKGHAAEVLSVAFGPDGSWLVSGAADNTARVWETKTGTERRVLRGHIGVVSAVAVNPDGKRILTGSFDATARLWNPATGHEMLELPTGYAGAIRAVAFSPNGERIALVGVNQAARVYDRTPLVLPLFPPEPTFPRMSPAMPMLAPKEAEPKTEYPPQNSSDISSLDPTAPQLWRAWMTKDQLHAIFQMMVPVTKDVAVDKIGEDGKPYKVIIKVTENVPVKIQKGYTLANAKVTDTAGQVIPPERLAELLKEETTIVVSEGGTIDDAYRQRFKDGVVFIVFPKEDRPKESIKEAPIPMEKKKDPPNEKPS